MIEKETFFIQFIVFFLAPLFAGGIIRKVRAWAQGRQGPPILQVFYETLKFLKKKPIDNPHSGVFSEISPAVCAFAAILIWSIVVFEWVPFLLIPFFSGSLSVFLDWICFGRRNLFWRIRFFEGDFTLRYG